MTRGRSALAAQVFFGSVLVLVVSTGSWILRGARPELWGVTPALVACTWLQWRYGLLREDGLTLPLAFLWWLVFAIWVTSGESLLAAAAAVPAVASLFLVVLDGRAFVTAAPRPPADPALERAAIRLWALAIGWLAAAVALARHEWVLAWPGVTLGALFGLLGWLRRRGLRPKGALPAAGVLGGAYVLLGTLALAGSPWGSGFAYVLAFLLFVALVEVVRTGVPPKPPPVPSPGPNR